jgi:hypothetical protein
LNFQESIREFKKPADTDLVFKTTRNYTYDFTVPPIPSHFQTSTLYFQLNPLKLKAHQLKKIKLLADSTYNLETDAVTWEKDGKTDGLTRVGNIQWLADCYKRTMIAAMVLSLTLTEKDKSEKFEEIEVKDRTTRLNRRSLEFPAEWLPKKAGV